MAVVLINGRAYDHTQLIVTYAGIPLPSVTNITYTEEQEKAFNMGTGNRPVSFGQGGISASGSIELSMNDIEAIRDGAPNGSLVQVPLSDLIITFINPQKPVNHVIKNLAWTNDEVSSSEGDTDIKSTLNFIASHITYR
jgi:hypothetical protein